MSQPVDQSLLIRLERNFPGNDEASFFARLQDILEVSSKDVWLDCEQVERITSHGVGVLWQTYQRCLQNGTQIHLLSVSVGMKRTLQALDLNEFFGLDPVVQNIRTVPSEPTASTIGLYSDTFRALETDVNDALNRFGVFIDTLDLEQSIELDLQTLFYEVATNIRHHAGLKPQDDVQFVLVVKPTVLLLSFTDPGLPFDSTRQTVHYDFDEAAKSGQTRGFGLALMRRMTDDMEYSREGGTHNLLTLTKRRHVLP